MSLNVMKSEAFLATISATERRASFIRLAACALIGACVGAVLGGIAFHALSADTNATAFIRITQPADLVAIAGGAGQTTPDTQDNTERYVAGEIAYLTGEGFAQAVGEKMGQSEPPELIVTQDGRSSMVRISHTARSRSDAIRTVQAAIDIYQQQLAQRTDQKLRIVLPALARWEQGADTVEGVQGIRQLRDRVELQAAQASVVYVVQPPTPDDASTHRWLIGAALGALLGGALAALGWIGRRRRAGRTPAGPEIVNSVDGVLVPVVNLRQPPRDSWGAAQASLARTLYAQFPSRGKTRRVVVIGASSSSGTAVVAELLRFAALENGPVQAIRLTDSVMSPPPAEPAQATLIVDAGPIGASNSTPDAIGMASDIVAVIRLGSDTLAQALVVRAATAASDAPLLAVFTSRSRMTSVSGN